MDYVAKSKNFFYLSKMFIIASFLCNITIVMR